MAGMYLVLSTAIGDIGAISGVILNGGGKLLELENSRGHEKDADEVGWDYLIQANINPRGLIDCFKTMKDNSPAIASEIPDFLSTHPALGNRIEYLEKKWEKLEKKDGFIKIDVNYQNFQQKLKTYLSENAGKTKTTESETPDDKKDEGPKEQE
jgi:predicted Zn-dependent protease